MNFDGSWLGVTGEEFTERLRCTATVVNVSSQPVQYGMLMVEVVTDGVPAGPGPAGMRGNPLMLQPGAEATFRSCGGGGRGSAHGNKVRIMVFFNRVDQEGVIYYPAMKYPKKDLAYAN